MKSVDGFFQAMRARDSAGLANVLTSRANWVTVGYKDGKATVSRREASADGGRMSGAPQDLDEQSLKDPVVRVDGDIALVSGSYQFKVGGKVSHCGYDSFHMLKETACGSWRAASIR
jgi:ketosteroid isomerase-like protein